MFFVARPRPDAAAVRRRPWSRLSSPARNEAGNIARDRRRASPEMGAGTELVFVEGGSGDDTWERIEEVVARTPAGTCMALRQTGKGKGDAVRAGFAAAQRRDPDDPRRRPDRAAGGLAEVLRRAAGGKGEFVNGVRLVYPMEQRAMRFLNLLGNKFFSLAFSWLLGQPVKDTLCGTKVLWRSSIRVHRGEPLVFRRLRPLRRLRPAVRRREAEPEDRGRADPLSRAHLRHDQHPAAGGTAGCCCGCWSSRRPRLKFV